MILYLAAKYNNNKKHKNKQINKKKKKNSRRARNVSFPRNTIFKYAWGSGDKTKDPVQRGLHCPSWAI